MNVIRFAVRAACKFDRFVLKRYLGIETPLYKVWWRRRSESIQRELDYERALRNLRAV